MQLVEVVSHDGVAADVLAAGQAFLGHIDRLPAPVKSAPGFLVNRALTPYLMEAFVMLDEGIKRETIDRAAEDFGMPMGPIELADQVGLDICLHVADVLRKELRRPMPATPKWLSDKVEKGELGRKTGKGMYEWKDGKAVKDSGAPAPCRRSGSSSGARPPSRSPKASCAASPCAATPVAETLRLPARRWEDCAPSGGTRSPGI